MTPFEPWERSGARLSIFAFLGAALVGAIVTVAVTSIQTETGEDRKGLPARGIATGEWGIVSRQGGVILGPATRPGVVEFGAYDCEACGLVHEQLLSELKPLSPDKSVRFRHAPYRTPGGLRERAAIASICAEFQGAFAPMHNALFGLDLAATPQSNHIDWGRLAGEVGVPNIHQFSACLSGRRARERLEADVRLARSIGIEGTPTFVTPEGFFRGRPPAGWFGRQLVQTRSQR